MEDSPINKLQQLMIITAEECGELHNVVRKLFVNLKISKISQTLNVKNY